MKKVILVFLLLFNASLLVKAQSCSINIGGAGQKSVNFFGANGCATDNSPALNSFTYNGDYAISIANSHTLIINGNVTINGTLTITLVGSTSEIFIESPYTLTATNVVFVGSATGKVVTVEGPDGGFIVDQTLDFGGLTLEIDGAGIIDATTISGADNTTCVGPGGDGTCPIITADNCTDGAGDFCSTSLPVTLTNFSASTNLENIALSWTTAKEENFSHFEIERSVDQKNYAGIGIVEGLGESLAEVHYEYTDHKAPYGQLYYRLKSVDNDGSFEYSPIVRVKKGLEGKMSISPNPSQSIDQLKINLPATFEGNIAKVTLYDINGMLIQEAFDVDATKPLIINKSLKAGMYLVKVQHNGLEENMRIIIQ